MQIDSKGKKQPFFQIMGPIIYVSQVRHKRMIYVGNERWNHYYISNSNIIFFPDLLENTNHPEASKEDSSGNKEIVTTV